MPPTRTKRSRNQAGSRADPITLSTSSSSSEGQPRQAPAPPPWSRADIAREARERNAFFRQHITGPAAQERDARKFQRESNAMAAAGRMLRQRGLRAELMGMRKLAAGGGGAPPRIQFANAFRKRGPVPRRPMTPLVSEASSFSHSGHASHSSGIPSRSQDSGSGSPMPGFIDDDEGMSAETRANLDEYVAEKKKPSIAFQRRMRRSSAPRRVGSRAQVWHGTAHHTSGGLTKAGLMKKNGRLVSRKASAAVRRSGR